MFTWLFCVFLGFLAGVPAYAQSGRPVVSTEYGPVRGFEAMDRLNRTYDGFLGVPFARPPVDSLRWQPPEPPAPWVDVLDTDTFSVHCIQPISRIYQLIRMAGNDSEDCLYLNVYIPGSLQEALDNPLPVMLWYYGGGLAIGTTEMYPGEELATTGEVIVVSANYRVSTMGFFSTGDAAAPGNYGFWDTKASLEWVNNNIANFGGDPTRITIFGQSSGGSIVSHLMLSAQTNQLFQRAITMSGAAGYEETLLSSAERLAGIFNCTTNTTQELVDCLMLEDGKELDNRFYVGLFSDFRQDEFTPFWSNVIDGTFTTQDPRDSWEQGVASHIDMMSGYTFHDAAGGVVGIGLALPLNRSDDGNRNSTELYEYVSNRFRAYDNQAEIVQTLYDRFPGMNDSDPATASQWVGRVFTDFDFACRNYYELEKHAEGQGTGSRYYYVFQHRHDFLDEYPAWINGSHLDDMYSILGEPFFKGFREIWLESSEYSEEDSLVSELIMHYYSNFAYSGNPNIGPHTMPVEWTEYDPATKEYLVETPTPVVQALTQEEVDNYNWFLYDFWGLLRPGWGVPLDLPDEFLADLLFFELDF